jgi:hypothetical protein
MAKRGRPKGGTSFTNISLEQLNELFGSKQSIPISRVWLERLDIKVAKESPIEIQSQKKASQPSEKIDIKIEA